MPDLQNQKWKQYAEFSRIDHPHALISFENKGFRELGQPCHKWRARRPKLFRKSYQSPKTGPIGPP
ncbi:hypothetical protein AB2B41_08390 [Marimonas sp. MJW-29]|uniref:Uncharacterized protein n=1 Tax=Sulfitobacter sediminis TaxID=3234186 RepID=A0ABV3RNE4_9RHOB